jgi:hypothetical protein
MIKDANWMISKFLFQFFQHGKDVSCEKRMQILSKSFSVVQHVILHVTSSKLGSTPQMVVDKPAKALDP